MQFYVECEMKETEPSFPRQPGWNINHGMSRSKDASLTSYQGAESYGRNIIKKIQIDKKKSSIPTKQFKFMSKNRSSLFLGSCEKNGIKAVTTPHQIQVWNL